MVMLKRVEGVSNGALENGGLRMYQGMVGMWQNKNWKCKINLNILIV